MCKVWTILQVYYASEIVAEKNPILGHTDNINLLDFFKVYVCYYSVLHETVFCYSSTNF